MQWWTKDKRQNEIRKERKDDDDARTGEEIKWNGRNAQMSLPSFSRNCEEFDNDDNDIKEITDRKTKQKSPTERNRIKMRTHEPIKWNNEPQ